MSKPDEHPSTTRTETATLAGGCFWCLEAYFDQLEGVHRVQSGYTGGHTADPSYEEVCTGRTGHAEAVRLTYDPDVVSYGDLLRIFFTMHDPTTKDRQGNDVGAQYRSAVFFETDEQRREAEAAIAHVEAAGLYPDPVVTEVQPLAEFYPAEDHHEDYFARNPNQPYCAAVISPKVVKFRHLYADRLKRPAATAAV